MTNEVEGPNFLGPNSAYQTTRVTKTRPYFQSITPRWLTRTLEWKALETGVYRVNRVKEGDTPLDTLCAQLGNQTTIPSGFVDYEAKPREYILNSISTIINVSTRIADVYSSPVDQVKEQITLGIESLRERQESQLLNNDDYGLLKSAAPHQRLESRTGSPTPDDLDELISRVWKQPSFFLAHPRAIAAFGRECTRRGVPPATVTLFGSPFLTWRGLPLFPSDKLFVDGQKNPRGKSGKTSILLIRTGEDKRGVIGLHKGNLPGEQGRGLSVRFMGINGEGVASYLLSMYCSAAVIAEDALAVLEDVDVGNYYDYT